MNTTKTLGAAVLIGAGAIVAAIAAFQSGDREGGDSAAAAARKAEVSVLYARRFQVEKPFVHVWRGDTPRVASGWLMVLSAPTDKLQPRQAKEPVLYVGRQTADRVNTGKDSGRVVVIVPGDFALEDAPPFFGSEALPEELGQKQIDRAFAEATASGVRAADAATLRELTVEEPLFVPTDFELRLAAIDLVEEYSPQEEELISGWRVPRVK